MASDELKASIALKASNPLASGKTQTVYQHPADPALLIKVRHHDRLKQANGGKLGGLLGYRRKHGTYTTWQREIEHYFSVCLRLGFHPPFLQEYRGVVETDLGLGLVVGRVNDRSGQLAPTLERVVSRTGLTDELRAMVESLLVQMNELRISTNDVSVKNIVCGSNRLGRDQLVLIEGIGVNTFVPLARYSNYFNIRSNNRHFARTLRSLEKLDRRRNGSMPSRDR